MLRNMLLASSGSLVAQVITMLSMVILSRLYSPEAFGLLGTFSAIVLILTAFACGKFDLAAVVEKGNGRSGLLALAGLAVTVVIAIVSIPGVLFVVLFYEGDGVFAQLSPFLWLVPVFVLAFGIQLILSQMLVRRGEFRTIAGSRIAQAMGASGFQMALVSFGTGGLIFGYVVGVLTSCLVLLRSISKTRFFLRARWTRVLQAASERRDFAFSASSTAGLNIAAVQLPLIFCALYFTAVDTGYFALSQRVLGFPAALIGLSISQAFMHDLRSTTDTQERREAAVSVYNIVLLVGVAPVAFLMAYGPTLFSVVFGAQWEQSGKISAYLAPFLVSIILATPFGNVFYVLEKQRLILNHTMIFLLLRVPSFVIPASLGYSFETAIICLAAFSFLSNFALFLHSLLLLGCSVWAFFVRFAITGVWACVLLLPGILWTMWRDNPLDVLVAMVVSAVAISAFIGLNVSRMLKER